MSNRVIAVVMFALVACGDSNDNSTCTETCVSSTCDGLTFRACEAVDDNACKALGPETSCASADPCQAGMCTVDGCTSVSKVCNEPPASTCVSASTVRIYDEVGACTATGSCDYAPHDTACSGGCVAGACVPTGVTGFEAYIKASNTNDADLFGFSVALSSDGSTLAIGASSEDSAATGIDGNQASNAALQAGAVYVFTRTGTTWSQQAYVKASNSEANDRFGENVALSADGSTLAVGATGEDSATTGINGNQTDNAAADAGAVYVFTRAGSTWTQQAYVKASNTDADDALGTSIALSGDGSTLAVGAGGEDSAATGIGGNQADNSANRAGAVYVFTRASTTWTQQAYLKASNTDANDFFGGVIALSGNGSTLAVGAGAEDSAATGIGGNQTDNTAFDAGAVYVFTRAAAVWTQQAYVKASNTEAGDLFASVALSTSGSTLAVGALTEDSAAIGIDGNQADNSANGSGAVYVFTRAGTTWTQQAYLKASNSNTGDLLGHRVAMSGDGSTLAVSAYREDSAATGINGNQASNTAAEAGAVYIFTRTATTWTQQAYVKASNTGTNDVFGSAVALSADGSTFAMGAFGEASAATGVGGNQADNSASAGAGAVYVYR